MGSGSAIDWHDHFGRIEFDLAGRQSWIHRGLVARHDLAGHRDDTLVPDRFSRCENRAGGVDDDLGHAIVIAQGR
jgi:hypothetical protein